jgi:hypothetical protein
MNLCEYQGKKVKIITTDGKNISGPVIAFTDEEEWDGTDPDGNSISVENDSGIIGVYEKEIKSIEVIAE